MQEITICLSPAANSAGNQPTLPSPRLQKPQTFSHAEYWYKPSHQLHIVRIHYLIANAGTVIIYQVQAAWMLLQPHHPRLIKQHPQLKHAAAELTTENILCREP